jgi:hypothetical protein
MDVEYREKYSRIRKESIEKIQEAYGEDIALMVKLKELSKVAKDPSVKLINYLFIKCVELEVRLEQLEEKS